MLLEEPGGRPASRDEHLELLAVSDAPAVGLTVDEVAECGDAVLDLVHTGPFHVP